MKKVIIIIVVLIAVIYFYRRTVHGGGGTAIPGYKGCIESVSGNVLTLNSGLNVQMLGVESDRIDVEMFINSSFIGKQVTLYSDSQSDQEIQYSDQTIKAYVIDDESGQCINHLVVNDINDAYKPIELIDSTNWIPVGSNPTIKKNLALYMKQRTFLITTDKGIGTGFFINENGLAVTNWHVMTPMQESSSVAILYQNNPDDSQVYSDKKRSIKNVLWSQDTRGMDITIFSVDLENGEKVPYFNLVRRHAPVGDKCATFGNPNGLTASYSTGDISAYRPDENRTNLMMMQYTMSTNGGNSGGPVCDIYGQVIAVHELGRKDLQNVNFGIDILHIRKQLDALGLKYGGK